MPQRIRVGSQLHKQLIAMLRQVAMPIRDGDGMAGCNELLHHDESLPIIHLTDLPKISENKRESREPRSGT